MQPCNPAAVSGPGIERLRVRCDGEHPGGNVLIRCHQPRQLDDVRPACFMIIE